MAKDDDAPVLNKKEIVARNDAYTGMLVISLVALAAGTLLLFLDLTRYGFTSSPTKPHQVAPVNPDPNVKGGDADDPVVDKKGKLPPPVDGKLPKGPPDGKQPNVK